MPDYVDIERMEKVEHRLTLVENALFTVISQNETTNTRLSVIEGRMDRLEDNQRILAEEIRLQGERIGSLEGQVSSLRDEMRTGFDHIAATLATILQRLS